MENNAQQIKQDSVQPQQPETTEVADDRHEQINPYSSETIIKDLESIMKKQDENEKLLKQLSRSIPMPSATYNKVVDFFQKIEKYIEENGEDSISEKQRGILEDIRQSSMYTLFRDMFYSKVNNDKDNYVNDIHYADKTINMKSASITKSDGDENVSGLKAINRFRSLISVGEVIQLPLWHSGFWVLIKPPTQAEIANLQTSIASNEINLGRETNTLVYSNYSVVTNRILTEFVIDHINQTSIKGWQDLDLREYISTQDFYPLVVGMLSTMAPEGVNIIRYCSNATVNDETGKPKCDFFVSGTVDPKKLIWVNRKALTTKMLSHMTTRKFNETMASDMVKDYQMNINSLRDKTVSINLDNGKSFEVTFSVPSLKDYLVNGEAWVEEIITMAESMFTDTDNKDQKNAKVNNLSNSSVLGIYNTFVKSFKLPTGEIITDTSTFKEILSDLSLDDTAFKSFIDQLSEYISDSPIAVVATPTYTCPKCNKEQKEGASGPFKEFIPLDVVSHFFVLCGLRSRIIQQRTF